MLEELCTVLEMFEWVTDELQTNNVSVSRLLPSITYLKVNLADGLNACRYTKDYNYK
jgi:hypothetical protein